MASSVNVTAAVWLHARRRASDSVSSMGSWVSSMNLLMSLTCTVRLSLIVAQKHEELVKQLLTNKNVYEVDEATPASTHDLIILTQFKNLNEFKMFTDWLKSLNMVDQSRTVISPIYKQYRNKKGLISSVRT